LISGCFRIIFSNSILAFTSHDGGDRFEIHDSWREIFQLLLHCYARFQSISKSWWWQMWAILASWREIFQLLLQCYARFQSMSKSWWWQMWAILASWREIFQL
jgi:hypothetical protein